MGDSRQAPGARFHVDREGTLLHDGLAVRSAGILALFVQGLDEDEDGLFFRCGGERCAVVAEDAPFVVRSIVAVRERGGAIARVVARLGMGLEEPLDLGTLTADGRGVPYVKVRAGRFRARLSRSAYLALGDLLEADGAGIAVTVGGERIPVPRLR